MERFTYHKTGTNLRSDVNMLLAMLSADLIVVVAIAVFVPAPWRWPAVGLFLVLVGLVVWLITGRLRRVHCLDGQALQLDYGKVKVTIPLEVISRVERHHGGLPPRAPAGMTPTYDAGTDTLHMLAVRKNMVALTTDRPLQAKLGQVGLVEFTRIVLSVDEPDRFVAALAGTAETPDQDSSTAPAPTEKAELASSQTLASPQDRTAPHPAPGSALSVTGLTKQFGDFTAVHNLTLSVRPGEIFAFLGSNGAGKTTTIKMMVGLLRPTAGTVTVSGRDLWAAGPEARRIIGYVPDIPLLYEGLTAQEYLWLVAGLYNLPPETGRERAEELLAFLAMTRWKDHLIRNFSLGMKRKMAIAAALVHKPQVLLLDEVTNGLDPRAAREVKDFIRQAARSGTAILLTTHLLDVVEELADRIAIIDQGELRVVGTMSQLQRQLGMEGVKLEALFLAATGGKEAIE